MLFPAYFKGLLLNSSLKKKKKILIIFFLNSQLFQIKKILKIIIKLLNYLK
jgi:hypothetical protein